MAYGGKLMGMSAMVVSCQRDDLHPPCSLVDAVLEFHVSLAGPDTEQTLGGRLHTCREGIGTQILDHTFHSGALLRVEQPHLRREVAWHEDAVSMVNGSSARHDGIAPLARDLNALNMRRILEDSRRNRDRFTCSRVSFD